MQERPGRAGVRGEGTEIIASLRGLNPERLLHPDDDREDGREAKGGGEKESIASITFTTQVTNTNYQSSNTLCTSLLLHLHARLWTLLLHRNSRDFFLLNLC